MISEGCWVHYLSATLGDPRVGRPEFRSRFDLHGYDDMEEGKACKKALAELEAGGDGGPDANA